MGGSGEFRTCLGRDGPGRFYPVKPGWQKRIEAGIVLSGKAPRLYFRHNRDYSVV